jgi:hypothetical protein
MSNVTVTTSVLARAASYNLTALAAIKDELALKAADTANDSWLTARIAGVSLDIATHCNRVFAPELAEDLYDVQRRRYQAPVCVRTLQLSRWPVLSVLSVVLSDLGSGLTQALLENTDFRVDYATGELRRLDAATGRITAWEAMVITAQYTAGFGQFYAGETHTVPATPYQVTVTNAAGFSCPQAVAYASGALLALVTGTPSAGQYNVNPASGLYTFAAADAGEVLTFAYAVFVPPPDLVEIVLRLLTARFKAKGRDPALMQQDTAGVGTQRFWIGAQSGQDGPFPPDVEADLNHYRLPAFC